MIFEINLYLVLLCLLQMPMPSVSHLLSQMTLSKTFLKQCNCHPQKNCGARVKRKMWERIIYVINDACIYTHTHIHTNTNMPRNTAPHIYVFLRFCPVCICLYVNDTCKYRNTPTCLQICLNIGIRTTFILYIYKSVYPYWYAFADV